MWKVGILLMRFRLFLGVTVELGQPCVAVLTIPVHRLELELYLRSDCETSCVDPY